MITDYTARTTPLISDAFPELERGYITEKALQFQRDFERLSIVTMAFIETGDVTYLTELQQGLAWLAKPESPLQRELAYIVSKLPAHMQYNNEND